MCSLAIEFLMVLGGFYALTAGRLKLTNSISLAGRRARITGLFLMSPLVLSVLTGFIVGLLVGAETISEDTAVFAAVCEAIYILFGLLGAVVYAIRTKPTEPSELPSG